MSCHQSDSVTTAMSCFTLACGVEAKNNDWHAASKRHTCKSIKRVPPEEAVDALKDMMKRTGMTEEEIAERASIQSFLERVENGEVDFTENQIETLKFLPEAVANREAGLAPTPGNMKKPTRNIDDIPALPGEGEAKKVIIVRGLPGSGKSTWAKKVIAAHPKGAVARLNNDDFAEAMYADPYPPDAADTLATVREAALQGLLNNPSVKMIIVDNTNLNQRTVTGLAKIALRHGAEPSVDDRFLSVDADECKRRNAARDRVVPEEVIDKMAKQASRLKPWSPPPMPRMEKYPNDDESLPLIAIVDLDNTVALKGERGIYDWHRVDEDDPNPPVVAMVQNLRSQGIEPIVVTGRPEEALEPSQRWVNEVLGEGIKVYTKPLGDNRPADVNKSDIFWREIAGKYRVAAVFEDKDGPIHFWRGIGLPVFEVD